MVAAVVRGPSPGCNRVWELKKGRLIRDLREVAGRSPVLKVLSIVDLSDEIRAIVVFWIPTLVYPRNGEIVTAGPVVVGIRYHSSFLSAPPLPWGLVTVLEPKGFFHPNAGPGGGLCLGHPPAGIGMAPILHLTYAALTFASANCVEWEGLNPEAAQFVRSKAAAFPLVPTGLFETPPADLVAGLGAADFDPSALMLAEQGGVSP